MKIKSIVMAVAVVTAAAAAPAYAGEARVEAHGGYVWQGDFKSATAGGAVGYDFGQSGSGFFGIEGSVDKALADGGNSIWGVTVRGGTKVGEKGKLFADGGYSSGGDGGNVHAGAGYEHKISKGVYLTAKYRHYFGDNQANMVTAGVGVAF